MEMEQRKSSKDLIYQALFFLLSLSIPLGYYLFPFEAGPISLFGFRILLVLSAVVLLIQRDFVLWSGKFSKRLFWIMVIWILYAAGSYFIVIDHRAYFQEVFLLIKGLLILLVFQSFFTKVKQAGKVFLSAWICGLVIQLIICFIEMTYAAHFSGNFIDVLNEYPSGDLVRFIPVGTFDNPNNLSLYLLVTTAFLLLLFKIKPDRKEFWMTGLILCIVIILNTHSRFANIILVIMLIFSLLFYISNQYFKTLIKHKRYMALLGFSIAIVFAMIFYNGIHLMEAIESRISSENFSNEVRMNLIKNGWDFFVNSKGLGIGAGNFEPYIAQGKGAFETHGIINSHNWLIQILSQYGMLITLLLASWLIHLLYVGLRLILAAHHSRTAAYYWLCTSYMLLLVYVPLSCMPSNFLNNKFNWLVLFMGAYFLDNYHKIKENGI